MQRHNGRARGTDRRHQVLQAIENWALVLPDASEPFFHIYAEADNPETANNLLCQYVEKVEHLRG